MAGAPRPWPRPRAGCRATPSCRRSTSRITAGRGWRTTWRSRAWCAPAGGGRTSWRARWVVLDISLALDIYLPTLPLLTSEWLWQVSVEQLIPGLAQLSMYYNQTFLSDCDFAGVCDSSNHRNPTSPLNSAHGNRYVIGSLLILNWSFFPSGVCDEFNEKWQDDVNIIISNNVKIFFSAVTK